jgi:phospholipase C
MTLPNPATPGEAPLAAAAAAAPSDALAAQPIETSGNLPGFLHAALRSDLDLSPPADHAKILAHFQTIQTRGQAKQYMDEVRLKVRAGRMATKRKSMRLSST